MSLQNANSKSLISPENITSDLSSSSSGRSHDLMERIYYLPPSALAETHEFEPVDSHPDEQQSDDEGVANQPGGQGLKEKNTCDTPRKIFI